MIDVLTQPIALFCIAVVLFVCWAPLLAGILQPLLKHRHRYVHGHKPSHHRMA